MAGVGRAPKDPAQRRNRVEPKRGEWVDLDPSLPTQLPVLPKRAKGAGRWPARTVATWAAWRADPASAMFGPADIAAAVDLINLHAAFAAGELKLAAEIRQRSDQLGLSLKGKRDLRWRVPPAGLVVDIDKARTGSAADRMRKLSERAPVSDAVAG